MRYIGVDLHKTNFVVCFLNQDESFRLETFPLSKAGISRFTSELSKDDAVAVEVTQNIYYFYDQIKTYVGRIVLVDTYRFAIITASKKKTDKADAQALARFLKLDHLPEVPVPSEKVRQLRHLLQARETMVGMRTKLKNMGHAALTRNGIALSRSAFASVIGRERLQKRDDLSAADTVILQSALRQIADVNIQSQSLYRFAYPGAVFRVCNKVLHLGITCGSFASITISGCKINCQKDQNMELGNFSVSLAVKDIEASKLFYEKLGFTVFAGDQSQNWLIMKNGDHNIGLFQGMFEKNIITFNPGWSSDAQQLGEFTDVRELQRQLKNRGVEMVSEADESSTGPASFMIADPDGNTILVDQHV